MNTFLVVVAVLAAVASGVAAGRVGRMAAGLCKRQPADRFKEMSRREVERLLERVAKEPEPESVMGAMCYAAMPIPEVTEYVCPVCGEKTLYSAAELRFAPVEITDARAQFDMLQQVSDLDMRLEEVGYCSFCGPDSTEPHLVLEILYSDGPAVTSTVTVLDLRYLVGLFGDGLCYSTWNDGREPLKPELERIREILGLVRQRP